MRRTAENVLPTVETKRARGLTRLNQAQFLPLTAISFEDPTRLRAAKAQGSICSLWKQLGSCSIDPVFCGQNAHQKRRSVTIPLSLTQLGYNSFPLATSNFIPIKSLNHSYLYSKRLGMTHAHSLIPIRCNEWLMATIMSQTSMEFSGESKNVP